MDYAREVRVEADGRVFVVAPDGGETLVARLLAPMQVDGRLMVADPPGGGPEQWQYTIRPTSKDMSGHLTMYRP